MFLALFNSDRNDENYESIDLIIRKIKDGDKSLREDFISHHKSYIKKAVANFTKKFYGVENSDEYSIGLLAFNEAIDCYEENRNCTFFTFCSMVIRRRLIDYIKRNANEKTFPFSYFETENTAYINSIFVNDQRNLYEEYEFVSELADLKSTLKVFGITMQSLLNTAPKHSDSRLLCIKIAKVLAEDNALFYKLYNKGIFPKSQLIKLTNINRRTLERNRKFIIAAALIIGNGFDSLKNYINFGI
ncbi:MAG: RNA polymerase sigma factor SigI [Firmicutes bacterium ADurb.Bin419]|nr:MAG: RNA polymerase sigma factor SigI [Firmicutes bacterium ADurb.Bin419]